MRRRESRSDQTYGPWLGCQGTDTFIVMKHTTEDLRAPLNKSLHFSEQFKSLVQIVNVKILLIFIKEKKTWFI